MNPGHVYITSEQNSIVRFTKDETKQIESESLPKSHYYVFSIITSRSQNIQT